MLKIAGPALALVMLSAPAFAQSTVQGSIPADSVTVTHWYKQAVYDPNNSKIGDIDDVLVTKGGQITSLIIGVGGFLGMGEKDVAVPHSAVQTTTKDGKPYLVMHATKDELKNAHGFKYDKDKMSWVADAK